MASLNLAEQVLGIVERFGDRVFLIDSMRDGTYSFVEFHELACALAVRMGELGVRRGDRVVIVLENSAEFAALYFACLYLGAVAVPVSTKLHPREIGFILSHAGGKIVIHSRETAGLVQGMAAETGELGAWCLISPGERDRRAGEGRVLRVTRAHASVGAGWRPLDGVGPEDLFSVTFTSGTTSLPKGVVHRIVRMLDCAKAFNERLGLGPGSRFYHVFQMAYMAGFLNTLICPFLAGGSVVITRGFDPRLATTFWEAPIRYGANTLWVSPTMLLSVLRLDRGEEGMRFCRSKVETACVGTAPLPSKVKREFEARYGIELLESYGLSETLFVTTNARGMKSHPGSVGYPLRGVTLRVVDDHDAPLSAGRDGEIWIHTPFLMAGYLNYETLETECCLSDGYFAVGDIGHLASDGQLFITGRKKDLIIRGGVNISPRAIEDVLMEHESVAQAAVLGVPHEFYGEEIVAVVTLKAGYKLEGVRSTLQALCKANLSASSLPTRFVEMNTLPVSTSGKVQKSALRELLSVLSRVGNTNGE